MKKIFTLLLLTFAGIVCLAQPKITGHRGCRFEGPYENTLASLAFAQKLGIESVEFDIQLTSDKKILVYHGPFMPDDKTLSIHDMTFDEARSVVLPGGKLTVTFPRTVGQIPFNFPFKPGSQVDGHDGTGPEGKRTRASGALYYFGYGLSYTSFEYSNLRLSGKRILPSDSLRVSFDITNTGKYKGDEIAQLYIHDQLSSITVYEKMLRGFERVTLEPGETRTVSITLGPDAFKMLDRNMKPVIEPGEFDICIGASSVDIKLEDTVTILDPAHPE